MDIQILIALTILVLHSVCSLVLMLVRPIGFVRYHVAFAALFAGGLLETLEGARLRLGSSEIKITGALWLASLCFMVIFVLFHMNVRLRFKDFLTKRYFVFIVFVIVVQLVLGVLTFSSMLHFLEILYPFMIFVVAYMFLRTKNDSRSMISAFVWYSVILAIQVPINYLVFGYDDLNVLKYARVMSTSLLPAFFLFVGLGVHRHKGWFALAGVLLAIPLITVSRGATVAIFASVLIFGFRALYVGKQYKRLGLLLLTLLMISVGVWTNTAFKERSIVEGNADPLDEEFVNTSGRLRIWLFFFEKLTSSSSTQLLFGEGLGASDEFTAESDPSQWFKQPHSEYIRFFYNFGMVGLIIYFGMFTRFLKKMKGRRRGLPGPDPALADASAMLVYSLLILALYENFLLYNPFGFIQNAALLLAMTSRSLQFNEIESVRLQS